MIGIVVVSHSHALAQAAVAFAQQMVQPDRCPRVAVAAGLDAETLGTDAAAISEAIAEVDSPDGVLVLLDLGSAVLSTEMALEFVDPEVADRTRLSPAPLVEGLVSALVSASSGASLDRVDAEACHGLQGKQSHLGRTGLEEADQAAPHMGAGASATPTARLEHVMRNAHGLHARPIATLVQAIAGLDAEVSASNATRGHGPVAGTSAASLATLDLRHGDLLVVEASGPDADAAIAAVRELAGRDFGEPEGNAPASGVHGATATPARLDGPLVAPVHRLPQAPDLATDTGAGPGDVTSAPVQARTPDVAAELDRLERALDGVRALLTALPHRTDAEVAGLVAQVAGAQRVMLDDPALRRAVSSAIRSGSPAEVAVGDAFATHEQAFEGLGDAYLRERAQDVRSLRRLVLQALAGADLAPPVPATPHVLVGRELDAVTAALLRPGTTAAVLVAEPGTQGHGAIIAAALGVPFLAGVQGTDDLAEGVTITVQPDGRLSAD